MEKITANKKYLLVLGGYTILFLFICSHMSPLFFINEWSDANVYFNVGKCIFEGRTLYTEAFDHKGPLIFFIYGIGYLLSNDSFFGMFVIQSIAWIVMVYATFFTCRLYLDNKYAFFIALLIPVFLIRPMQWGGSAEEFILVFECVSLYLFARYFRNENASAHKPVYMFVHGLMFASAFLIKYNITVFWFFLVAGIFLNILMTKKYRNLIVNMLTFLGGVAIVSLPILIYLYVNNALGEAYDVYFLLNTKYAKVEDVSLISVIIKSIWRIPSFYLRYDTFVFVMVFIGMVCFAFKCLKNKIARYSFLLSGVALYSVINIASAIFDYYVIPLLIFAIPGMIFLMLYLKKVFDVNVINSRKFIVIVTLAVFMVGLSRTGLNMTILDTLIRGKASSKVIDTNPVLTNFASIIKKEKEPTLLNLNFDETYALFTMCNIKPNVRFFITPNLKEEVYPEMKTTQRKYVENKEVQFIVFSDPFYGAKQTDAIPAIKENYTLVKSDTLRGYVEYGTIAPGIYYLYKRKD